jgi:hypothetical protein
METRDMDIVRDVTPTLLEFLKKRRSRNRSPVTAYRSVYEDESGCKT